MGRVPQIVKNAVVQRGSVWEPRLSRTSRGEDIQKLVCLLFLYNQSIALWLCILWRRASPGSYRNLFVSLLKSPAFPPCAVGNFSATMGYIGQPPGYGSQTHTVQYHTVFDTGVISIAMECLDTKVMSCTAIATKYSSKVLCKIVKKDPKVPTFINQPKAQTIGKQEWTLEKRKLRN